jgi:FtsZ-interacting cell division protein ZipA
MDHRVLYIVIAAIFIVGLLLVAWIVSRRRRTELLQDRFGPEYERTVRHIGTSRAEADLIEREKRVQRLPLRELTAEEQERFVSEWRAVQSRFVDTPEQAMTEADRLVDQLMQARGYPVADFEQRAADISVDHPRVVDNYRAARHIASRYQRGEATTEDLRKAILYYRSLFDDLLHPTLSTPRKEVA